MSADNSNAALKDVAFGSMAGMTAKIFEHPFDLVKVRLQSQPTDRPLAFQGPFDCFRQTYLKEGWRGLYRGLSMPIIGAAAENATLFLVYGQLQNAMIRLDPRDDGLSEVARGKRRELSTPELALAAAGAGAVTSFVLTPIELIKCRMQVQMLAREGAFGAASISATPTSPSSSSATLPASQSRSFHTSLPRGALHPPPPSLPPLQGPLALALSTFRQHGLRGLWLGQIGTLLRETGGSSAWFTAYELSSSYFLSRRQHSHSPTSPGPSRVLTKADLPTYQLMLSGALAGMSYNVVLFPADSVKSALQTWAELYPDKPRLGFWQMANRIWNGRGIRGLYAGCGLTVMRSAPSSAMIFAIYETLKARFG